MVAESRDIDAGCVGNFDQHLAGSSLDLDTVFRRIADGLREQGHKVTVLPDRQWVVLSERLRVLSIADFNQDSVLLMDLTTGEFLPVMAELDAHPEASPAALVVRPLIALTPGNRIAVVVTTEAMVAEKPEKKEPMPGGAPGMGGMGGMDF